ncbi:hypothetical protein [Spiroplasma endosymbiont of Panorpa germanica]|uniref:hypothetical protein n=1 Tax=Spiroplasma endosymbiont of Panorpa germanica TaxID=3066314 RepID=UPI0030D04073
MKNKKRFIKFYGLNNFFAKSFLDSVRDNFDYIKNHKNKCVEKINSYEELINEIEIHIFQWQIQKFIKDWKQAKSKDEINFKEDYTELTEKIVDELNYGKNKTELYMVNFFKKNFNYILTMDETLLSEYFREFLQDVFFQKKYQVDGDNKIKKLTIDRLANEGFMINIILNNFKNFNKDLKYYFVKIIEKNDFYMNDLYNCDLFFECLLLYFDFSNEINKVEKIFNKFTKKVLEDKKWDFHLKEYLLKKFKFMFEKSRVINSSSIQNNIKILDNSVQIDHASTTVFGKSSHFEMSKDDLKKYTYESKKIINNNGFLFLSFNNNSEKLLSYLPNYNVNSNLVKILNPGNFSQLKVSVQKSSINNIANFFNVFFINNPRYYAQYYLILIRKIDWILNYFNLSNYEIQYFKSHFDNLFSTFQIKWKFANLAKMQCSLFSIISVFENLLKMIYFKNYSNNGEEKEFKPSRDLIENYEKDEYNFKTIFLDFISKETIETIYWHLYLDIKNNGLDLRNSLMHGDVYKLENNTSLSYNCLRIILLSTIEEIFYNIFFKNI